MARYFNASSAKRLPQDNKKRKPPKESKEKKAETGGNEELPPVGQETDQEPDE